MTTFREKFPSFTNYTEEMYNGNASARKDGVQQLNAYECMYGSGVELDDDTLLYGTTTIQDINIYITGNSFKIAKIVVSDKNETMRTIESTQQSLSERDRKMLNTILKYKSDNKFQKLVINTIRKICNEVGIDEDILGYTGNGDKYIIK